MTTSLKAIEVKATGNHQQQGEWLLVVQRRLQEKLERPGGIAAGTAEDRGPEGRSGQKGIPELHWLNAPPHHYHLLVNRWRRGHGPPDSRLLIATQALD